MGQALYRKYRSKSLDDIVGQEHITDTLKRALKKGQISHAYLFTGPRGVGKTSVARILAHAVNGLEYSDDNAYLDIIEIDAASNRRIDEIRDLRDKVHIAPAAAKYKIYIIDEAHMLTREAFNALLKTLEEPPKHVIFILATTEAHKLPETIVSRTQRFSFRPIDSYKVKEHLKEIASKEKIDIEDEALALIAEHGEGSFRDSISMLDQASTADRKITAETINNLLGKAPVAAIRQLLTNCASGNPSDVINRLQDLFGQGVHAPVVAKQLGELIREELAENKLSLKPLVATGLLQKLINVPASADPQRWLEVVLLEVALGNMSDVTVVKPVVSNQTIVEKPAKTIIQEIKPDIKTPTETATSGPFDIKKWPEVLAQIKKTHNTLYSILRMADANYIDSSLILGFGFSFHLKRANEAQNKQILSNAIEELYGLSVQIICELRKKNEVENEKVDSKPTGSPEIESISNIFGHTELLES